MAFKKLLLHFWLIRFSTHCSPFVCHAHLIKAGGVQRGNIMHGTWPYVVPSSQIVDLYSNFYSNEIFSLIFIYVGSYDNFSLAVQVATSSHS